MTHSDNISRNSVHRKDNVHIAATCQGARQRADNELVETFELPLRDGAHHRHRKTPDLSARSSLAPETRSVETNVDLFPGLSQVYGYVEAVWWLIEGEGELVAPGAIRAHT